MLAFTSADIFHKFIKLHHYLTKRFLSETLLFSLKPQTTHPLNGRDPLILSETLLFSLKPQTTHPLNGRDPLNVTKIFCWRSLIAFFFFFFRTRASTVIPTKWCKTFEACTWTILYNLIRICQFITILL